MPINSLGSSGFDRKGSMTWRQAYLVFICLMGFPFYIYGMGPGTEGMPCGPGGCDAAAERAKVSKAAQENKDILGSPFLNICNHEDGLASLKGRPNVWALQRCIPTEDRGSRGVDFLEALIGNAKLYVEASVKQNEKWKACIDSSKTRGSRGQGTRLVPGNEKDKDCTAILKDVSGLIPSCSRVARHHLARSYNKTIWNSQVDLWPPNSNLDEMGSLRPSEWEALTEEEKTAALKTTQRYNAEASRIAELEMKKPPGQRRSVDTVRFEVLKQFRTSNPLIEAPGELETNGTLLRDYSGCGEVSLVDDPIKPKKVIRSGHYQAYNQILARWPILNYIEKPNPSKQDISRAITKLNQNAKAELKELERLHELALASQKTGDIPPDLLKGLNYAAIAESLLGENPEFCGIVSSLEDVRASRNLSMDTMITAPFLAMVGVGMVITLPGWAVGGIVAAGVGTSGYYIQDARSELNRANQNGFRTIEGDDSVTTLAERQALQDAYTISVATSPLALIGTGPMFRAAGRLFQRGARLPYQGTRLIRVVPDDVQ